MDVHHRDVYGEKTLLELKNGDVGKLDEKEATNWVGEGVASFNVETTEKTDLSDGTNNDHNKELPCMEQTQRTVAAMRQHRLHSMRGGWSGGRGSSYWFAGDFVRGKFVVGRGKVCQWSSAKARLEETKETNGE